ncbi:MAG: magnesium transporter [Candidatus Limnocylindrales bacterium]
MTMPDLVAMRDVNALTEWLAQADPLEIAEELGRLPVADRAIPFRLLPKDRALEVFEALDPLHQQELLQGLREASVRELVEDMDPDDRARLVDEMPAKVAKQVLGGLSPRERALTATLLGYPENSAGRVMSPEVVNLKANQTVADALARIRRIGGSAETIYALPVTDDARRLVGALGLRDLVLADPDQQVGDLMDREVYSARVNQDQEEVARLIQEADLLALPIVDTEGRLVGIVTVDDAMRILEEEQTEDVARAGGAEPLEHPYLSTSVLGLARTRVVWLMVLIVAATLTVNVLGAFEVELAKAVALALFIPLVIGTGGNAGSQSATTVTRALAVGELRPTDVLLVVLREARVGVILGGMLAALAFVPTLLFIPQDPRLAYVVSLTLLSVCTLATLVGSLLPLLARRLGFDPAVMSAPLISTLVDATGLLVYFLIAKAILGI